MRKQSKQLISRIQRKIWELCKKIIRLMYGNVCYTCGQENLSGSNWHTGHLFPKASLGAFLKYDLRLLRPQCYYCNINLGGNGAVFIEKMREIEGDKYVDEIIDDRQKTVKAYDHYIGLIPTYTELLESLSTPHTCDTE